MKVLKKQKCLIFGFTLILIAIPILLAQEARIDIEHTGYGQTSREAKFTISNIGEIRITNITLLVDGEEHKTITGGSSPGNGLMTSLFLDPGEHLIEAITPEGAYDSLNLTISSAIEKEPVVQEETEFIPEENLIWIFIGIIIIIAVMVVWLLLRKPKLELEVQYQQYS